MPFKPDANAQTILEECVDATNFSDSFIRSKMYEVLARRNCQTDSLTEAQIVQVVNWVQTQQ